MEEPQTNLKGSPFVEQENEDKDRWMKVTVGAVGGILLGGGSVYAATQADNTSSLEEGLSDVGAAVENISLDNTEETVSEENAGEQPDASPSSPAYNPTIYTSAPIAHVSNNLSFADAFAAARAQVGPGGVFSWHGGVYGTYYETEWDAMSDAQRMQYAQSVHTEYTPHEYHEMHPMAHHQNPEYDSDVEIIDDVEPQVVARGTVAGHEAVAIDVTGNNDPDVMIIDADDSHSLTDPDVVIDTDGNFATVGGIRSGEIIDHPDYTVSEGPVANSDNPDVAPEMPDYMDDANVVM